MYRKQFGIRTVWKKQYAESRYYCCASGIISGLETSGIREVTWTSLKALKLSPILRFALNQLKLDSTNVVNEYINFSCPRERKRRLKEVPVIREVWLRGPGSHGGLWGKPRRDATRLRRTEALSRLPPLLQRKGRCLIWVCKWTSNQCILGRWECQIHS